MASPPQIPDGGPLTGTETFVARQDGKLRRFLLSILKGATGDRGPAGFGTVTPATPTRAFGSAFRPNADKAVAVSYSVKTQVTNPLVAGNSTATVRILSDAANPPTTERGRCEAVSGVGLAVTIALTTANTAVLSYIVPPGHYVLLTSAGTGTFANSIAAQTETTLG